MNERALLVALATAACAQAKPQEPASPEALLARAFELPIAAVLEATSVEVDRRPVATVGRFARGGDSIAAVVATDGTERELGNATQLYFAGLVDLAGTTTLRLGPRRPAGLKTSKMKQAALTWVTRHTRVVAATPKGTIGAHGGGTRKSQTYFIFDLQMHLLLRLETEERSEDGFGGFSLGPLELTQRDGKTHLTTRRQDHLPARRARCLEPEAYELRFERINGGRFRELPVDRPPTACP